MENKVQWMAFCDVPFYKKVVLPYTGDNNILIKVYSDEFELVNPIGVFRNKYKVSVIYYQLMNLRPCYKSKVLGFYLALYKDVKIFGRDKFLGPFVNALQVAFYEGIELNGCHFHLICLLFVSDNLTSHACSCSNADTF